MATQVALFLCPSNGAAAGRRLRADELRLLHRQRDQRRRRDRRRRRVHPGDAAIGRQRHRRHQPDGRGLGAIAGDRRAVLAALVDARTRAPVAGDGPRRRGAAHRRRLALAGNGWLLNKGSSWWDGNYQNALYNHYLTPDANRPDCIVYHNPGWKAARSYHPGGVNLLYCDGHAAFIKDSVNPAAWRAISTRRGRDYLGRCPLKIDARWGIRSRPQIS